MKKGLLLVCAALIFVIAITTTVACTSKEDTLASIDIDDATIITHAKEDTLDSIGIDGAMIFTDANVLIYRDPINLKYYVIDCDTRKIIKEAQNLNTALVAALDVVPTNGKIIGGGAGGWYTDETIVIKGKAHPNFGTYPAGFQEVVIDFEKIEFVMTGDKNRDFIQIDSILGTNIRFGVIAASPNEGYAAVRVIPRLPVQYSQSVGVYGLKLDIVMISGGNSTGTGLALGGSGTKGPLRGINAHIGMIDGYKRNFVLKNSTYENMNCNINIITNSSGMTGAVLITVESASGFNHVIKSHISTLGTGAIITGYDSKYEFNVTECAPDSAFILNASRNLVIASGVADLKGWTDNGDNKVITPGN